jgi:hypothetical protein
MNRQDEDTNTDSLFSDECYKASTKLATTLGALLVAIKNNQEIDWWSAQQDCLAAKIQAMMLEGRGSAGIRSRLAGFLLLHPLVNRQTKDWNDWTTYLETLRHIFPAWDASVIQGESPESSKEDAETMAYLRFDQTLMESVFPSFR